MSTEAGAAEGTGPPDMLPEDNTCEDTAESVYRRCMKEKSKFKYIIIFK